MNSLIVIIVIFGILAFVYMEITDPYQACLCDDYNDFVISHSHFEKPLLNTRDNFNDPNWIMEFKD